jgi:hypothetical protein
MLQLTEENDIPGLLLLIDFEKAFDFISWDFLLSVLKFFKGSCELLPSLANVSSTNKTCLI